MWKKFLNKDFKAIVTIDKKGIVSGKIINLQIDEENTNIRTEMTGEFRNSNNDKWYGIIMRRKNYEQSISKFLFSKWCNKKKS